MRYAAYLVGLPITLVGWAIVSPLFMLLMAFGAGVYLRQPYRRLRQVPMFAGLSFAQKVQAAALIPVIRLVGDLAKMLGYPVGVVWRMRHSSVHNAQHGNQ